MPCITAAFTLTLLRACPASVDGLCVSAERPRITIISSPRHRHLQGVNHEGGKQGSRLVLASVLATDHLQGSLGGQPPLGAISVSRAGGLPFPRIVCVSCAEGCPTLPGARVKIDGLVVQVEAIPSAVVGVTACAHSRTGLSSQSIIYHGLRLPKCNYLIQIAV